MQSLFANLHGEDYVSALDIAMCNLVAEGGQPFLADWQVHETIRCKASVFESCSSKEFVVDAKEFPAFAVAVSSSLEYLC